MDNEQLDGGSREVRSDRRVRTGGNNLQEQRLRAIAEGTSSLRRREIKTAERFYAI